MGAGMVARLAFVRVWAMGLGAVMLLACALPAAAQGFEETLGDEITAILKERPDAFRKAAQEVIAGYGRDGRIDVAGIEQMVAIRRAALRATQSRRLLLADLDNDGTISRAEVGAVLPALSASQRPRLLELHRRADADGNGGVDPLELRDFAQDYAESGFDEAKAATYRRVMLADMDGDGWVTMDEVARVVEASRMDG
ncbi:MAG: hypothetical protein COC12_11790 [Rhodobacteraceae bacterium]|nr:MAG: hypothetical protein COC12_11790 [Paracoccaceae bacterium]